MSTNAVAFQIPTSDIEAKPEFFTKITHTLYGNTKISRHDATGNYFITGIVKNYNEEKMAEYESFRSKLPSLRENLEKAKASGNDDDIAIAEAQLNDIESLQKPKEVFIAKWLENKETKKFLTEFKNTIGCSTEQVAFKIMGGVNEFRGTYAHRYVVHHLLHWMDSMYAIKVAQRLDHYLVEETERYKEQAEEAKTNELKAKKRYKKLSNQMKKFSEEAKLRDEEQAKTINEQSDKLDKLLDYGSDAELILSCKTDYPRTIEKKLIEQFDSMFDKKLNTNEYYHVDIPEKQVKHLFMRIFMQVEEDTPDEDSIQMFSDNIVTNISEAIESIEITANLLKLVDFLEGQSVCMFMKKLVVSMLLTFASTSMD